MLDLWSRNALSSIISSRLSDVNMGISALDRSTFSDIVSSGTVGFQLSAYCIGHERGWADKQVLENRVVTLLQNLMKLPTGPRE